MSLSLIAVHSANWNMINKREHNKGQNQVPELKLLNGRSLKLY